MEEEQSKEVAYEEEGNELLSALRPKRDYNKEMMAAGATPLLIGFLTGNVGDAAGIAAQGIETIRKEQVEEDKLQMKSLAQMLKERRKASSAGKLQQTTIDVDGVPTAAAFDPSTGKTFLPNGQEVLNPIRGYKPDIRIDPRTKELAKITSSKGVQPLSESNTISLREKELGKKVREKMLQDVSYKSLKASYEAADDVITLVSSENPIAQAGTIVATAKGLFREVGNLSQGEQDAIRGNPSFMAALERQYGKIFEGKKLTAEDMNDFIEMATIIKDASSSRLDQVYKKYSESEKDIEYARPGDKNWLEKSLSRLGPATMNQEKALKRGREKANLTVGYTKEVKGKKYRYRGNNQWEEIK